MGVQWRGELGSLTFVIMSLRPRINGLDTLALVGTVRSGYAHRPIGDAKNSTVVIEESKQSYSMPLARVSRSLLYGGQGRIQDFICKGGVSVCPL